MRDGLQTAGGPAERIGGGAAIMQALGVAGWKNSGKTTLITRLIPALMALGHSVSTVKHVHHSIDLDQPGKDTFVHREAGAVDVAMVSEQRWAILHEVRVPRDRRIDLDDILRRLTPVDLVILEGFKSLPMKRIEIRSGADVPPIRQPGDADIVAIVTDGTPDPDLPSFRRDDVGALAAFVSTLIRAAALRW